MTTMAKGANIAVGGASRCVPCCRGRPGPGVPDVDASALLLQDSGRVSLRRRLRLLQPAAASQRCGAARRQERDRPTRIEVALGAGARRASTGSCWPRPPTAGRSGRCPACACRSPISASGRAAGRVPDDRDGRDRVRHAASSTGAAARGSSARSGRGTRPGWPGWPPTSASRWPTDRHRAAAAAPPHRPRRPRFATGADACSPAAPAGCRLRGWSDAATASAARLVAAPAPPRAPAAGQPRQGPGEPGQGQPGQPGQDRRAAADERHDGPGLGSGARRQEHRSGRLGDRVRPNRAQQLAIVWFTQPRRVQRRAAPRRGQPHRRGRGRRRADLRRPRPDAGRGRLDRLHDHLVRRPEVHRDRARVLPPRRDDGTDRNWCATSCPTASRIRR